VREEVSPRALLCGVRPEHVRFDDASGLRAEVLATEYLGTSTVVTLATAKGATVRAKVGVGVPVARGDHVGLAFDASKISLFDAPSGRALRTARDETPLRAGRRARHG
jgi:multiple sugar transport system ATP-binding protein